MPSAVRPCPTRLMRSSASMVTITVAGIPPVSGMSPARSCRSQRSSSASCSRCPWVRPSTSPDGIDPRFGQRVEQRLEFGAGGPGEPEVPDIGAVPGRAEMKVAPVFVELIVGHGAVGVDGIHDPVGEELEVLGWEHRRMFGQQRLTGGDVGRVEAAPIHLVEGAFDDRRPSPHSPHRSVAPPPTPAAPAPRLRRASTCGVRPPPPPAPGRPLRVWTDSTPTSAPAACCPDTTPSADPAAPRRR